MKNKKIEKQIEQMLQNYNLTHQEKPKISDYLFKGLTTISSALIVWIFTTVNKVQQDVQVMKSDSEHQKEMFDEVKEATKSQFTGEDFKIGTSPIIKQLNSNTDEINRRSTFMNETNGKIIKMELQIEELKRNIK